MSTAPTIHPRDEAERMKKDPLLFFRHIATFCGFKIAPYQENLMQRYFQGEPVDSLMPPPEMPQPKPRQTEDLTLEPRKGWTLAALFIEYVCKNNSIPDPDHPDDPEASELFNASHMHYRLNGNGHSYHDIVDLRSRMRDLAQSPGAPTFELLYDEPELLDDRRLDHDVMRVLRTMDKDTKYVTEDGGAVLSNSCIIDVIQQLHLRLAKAQSSH